MSELFLIAHKVRGEPAFDIAERMECPICAGEGSSLNSCDLEVTCHECDSLGYWWIIPTSGHRAYPYWYLEFYELIGEHQYKGYGCEFYSVESMCPDDMPSNLPDHYPLRHTPSAPRVDILALLPQEPKATIRRRL